MNPEKRNMLQVDVEDTEKADEIFTLLIWKKEGNQEEILFKNMPLRFLQLIINSSTFRGVKNYQLLLC